MRVLVFLSPTNGDSNLLFSVLRNRVAEKIQDNQSSGDPDAIGQALISQHRQRFTSQEERAMVLLLDRPWWTRTWVIQELVVAKEAAFIWGNEAISWEYMIFGILPEISPTAFLGWALATHKNTPNVLSMFAFKERFDNSPDPMTLLDLLARSRRFQATDPRDKIYGLLGLASANSGEFVMKPDYTISVRDCYKRAALALITDSRSLEIFNLPAWYFCTGSSLPSWVPDFQQSPDAVEMGSSWSDYSHYFELEREVKPQFDAAKHQRFVHFPEVDGDTLYLREMAIDFITDVEVVLKSIHPPGGPNSNFNYLFRLLAHIPYETGSQMSALLQWDLVRSSLVSYPSGENVSQAFCATLYKGNTPGDIVLARRDFERVWNRSIWWPRLLHRLLYYTGWKQQYQRLTERCWGCSYTLSFAPASAVCLFKLCARQWIIDWQRPRKAI